ncbi:methyltransferase domain-containing protein [Nannocystis pusilla]|uniref:Class I SAM-dependent methyltransferase n=1 Tax=Nannocystis pusilla TaxID=889268 RepID=A0ABS7TJN2_9BACT|nr:methyltransferase domain-containing protein [Nannocystis pusilla]MBZ5708440.1 class I SAM-dependent methyltransferase [Nannocystis pusilla]
MRVNRRLTLLALLAASTAVVGLYAARPGAHDPDVHTCNLCGLTGRFDAAGGRPGAACPRCKSRERHRLLLHWLENETTLPARAFDVLHFSPMPGEKDAYRRRTRWRYRTADSIRGREDLYLDLTSLLFLDDATWDLLIVYHVLEHIEDDRAAIGEMYRVLRPGGLALVQVPLEPGRTHTYEDPTIVDPYQRLAHFGQGDHVRIYAARDLKSRLEAAGFVVEPADPLSRLPAWLVARHGLSTGAAESLDERIWLAKKPRR